MGNYTNYTLDVHAATPSAYDAIDNEVYKMGVFDSGDAEYGYMGSGKWFACDEDMQLLSARFPDVLFELTGEGGDSSDTWRNYYKGGRVMRNGIEVKMIYHDFDPAKLEGEPIDPEGKRYSYEC